MDQANDKSARVESGNAAPTTAGPSVSRVQFERLVASRPVNEQIQLLRPAPGIQLSPAMDWRTGAPLESGSSADGAGGGSTPALQLTTPSNNSSTSSASSSTTGSNNTGTGNQGTGSPNASPFAGKSPRQIIEDECNGNWSTVKTKVLTEQNDQTLMQQLCDFRKEHIDGIIAQLKGLRQFGQVGSLALGSQALTSDYDITFSGLGSIQAVIVFNRMFKETRGWGKESGTVFDTNVYAQSILPASKAEVENGPLLPVSNQEGQELDAFYQDVAALTKVRRYMTASQWQTHRGAIVNSITDSAVKAEMAKRYDAANEAHLQHEEALHNEIIRLYPSAREAYPSLSREELVEKITQEDEDAAIRASNRLYEQKLLAVAAKTRERETEAKKCTSDAARDELINRYNAEIRSLHSEALQFANEPYFAAGTLLHVVGNLQGKYGLDLTTSDVFQSLNENYGDAKKDFGHYGGAPFGKAAFRSSKYVYRFTDAAKLLSEGSGGKVTLDGDSRKTRAMWAQSEKLLKIRQGETFEGKNYAQVPEEQKITDAAKLARPFTEIGAIEGDVDRISVDLNKKARTFKVGT